jgi:cytochrome c oxidase subunit 2
VIERYLKAASSSAGDIDSLIGLIAILVGFWFVVVEVIFFWLLWRFRRRAGKRSAYITGEKKSEKRWINYPHLAVLACDVVVIVFAVRVWVDVKQTLPEPDARVRVVAQQWAWTFVHPGVDGVLDTDDDVRTTDELHVEVNKTYHFELSSKDVVHSFSVPAFRLKQDAVPGRVIRGWFRPTQTGTFDVQCAEICGIGHGLMPARLVIDDTAAHAAWLERSAPVALSRLP